MKALASERNAVSRQWDCPRYLGFAAEEVNQRLEVKLNLEKPAPVFQQADKGFMQRLAAIIGFKPPAGNDLQPFSRIWSEAGVDEFRLDLRRAEVNKFPMMNPLEKKIIEEL